MADETQTGTTTAETSNTGNEDVVKRAAYERDNAKAEAQKLKRQLDELQKSLPSDEQKARWAELEKQHETAEEERKRKAGEFDKWREQINTKHESELKARERVAEEERNRTAQVNQELNNTLIGLQFAGASKLFGAAGKTVLPPDIAQSYFANRVEVQVDEKTGARSVIVKDAHGTTIVDEKTGRPMEFEKAMTEVIDSYPAKELILRGSGKSGSNSPGGGHGLESRDLNNLRPSDFADPKVREAVRRQQAQAGGMQIGPAFDRMRKAQ